ncbi:MAG: hypothetical protein M4579_004712 [Chaenotheca gracillima]|nr:MAG: hypothetical protein M4579_004712 [Chaenotheca gracillima]
MAFFEGTIQSGIQTALAESKSVVCFIRDGNDESRTWENEFLRDEATASVLKSKAVLLRIEMGSQEAGWLSSFCAVEKAPTLIIIHNGTPRDTLAAGLTQQEFCDRLLAALPDEGVAQPLQSTSQADPQGSSAPTSSPSSSTIPNPSVPRTTTAQPSAPSAATTAPRPPANNSPIPERPSAPASESTSSASKGKAPASKPPNTNNPPATSTLPKTSKPPKSEKYAEEQRKRVQDARSERERILRRVEADKAERRHRAESERLLRQGATPSQTTAPEPAKRPKKTGTSPTCALQVRLLSGATLRKHFPDSHGATLRQDVRPWIDTSRTDGDDPYTFKQIMTPLPNRTIEITEEDQSLAELGLTPNATLVLFPLPRGGRIAGAYDGAAADQGWLGWGFGMGYRAAAGVAGTVGGVLGINAGGAQGDGSQGAGSERTAATARNIGSGAGVANTEPDTRIRTLHDQRLGSASDESGRRSAKDRDHELYNGNQLNFEPRKDDDEKTL